MLELEIKYPLLQNDVCFFLSWRLIKHQNKVTLLVQILILLVEESHKLLQVTKLLISMLPIVRQLPYHPFLDIPVLHKHKVAPNDAVDGQFDFGFNVPFHHIELY